MISTSFDIIFSYLVSMAVGRTSNGHLRLHRGGIRSISSAVCGPWTLSDLHLHTCKVPFDLFSYVNYKGKSYIFLSWDYDYRSRDQRDLVWPPYRVLCGAERRSLQHSSAWPQTNVHAPFSNQLIMKST